LPAGVAERSRNLNYLNYTLNLNNVSQLQGDLSLPCVLLALHGKDIFAVQRLTAMIACTATAIFPVVVASSCVD
jgi:hypothetical protein